MAGARYEGVWKYYGSTPAVRGLDLEVRDGEFLVLVGPSGCGKTTTLRMLAGLELPSYGHVWIDDEDVTRAPPGRRDVAMVFQNYALFPHMSVFKNLAFGPTVRHEDRAERTAVVNRVAQSLGLESLLNRRPDQLSGGQRQRVALGRALVRQPKVFLLDEPLSNLDAALRVQMRGELIRLHREWKVTTIYVTHDQVEALTMGDRIAVFDQGTLLQLAAPTELYDAPHNLFVAEFIGSPKMNIFPGQVESIRPHDVSLQCLGQSLEIQATPRGGLKQNSEVSVGVRPHDIHLATEAPARCKHHFKGIVDLVEHTGAETFVEVTVAAQTRVMARIHRSTRILTGDRVTLALDPSDAHLFSTETGESLLQKEPNGRHRPAELGQPSAASS